jgi:hypothetical protein
MPTVLETIQHDTEDYEKPEPEENLNAHMEGRQDPIEDPSKIPEEENGIANNSDYFKVEYELNKKAINQELILNQERLQNSTGIKNPKKEYLHWHNKLGHLSHGRMNQLISNGTLPRYLTMKTPPICVACINGKTTRKPWRTKAALNPTANKAS